MLRAAMLPARVPPRLQGDFHRLRVGELLAGRCLLLLEELKRMLSSEAAHLLEAFDRYQGRQRLALSCDDELVVTQGHAVEDVADTRPHIHG